MEKKGDYQIKTSGPEPELDTSIAFLQVPTKIKDQVETFIAEIADETDVEKMSAEDTFSPFQSTGCFFVISLEKIEQIHEILRKALDPTVDDIDTIRAEVQNALSALQG